MTQMSTIHWFVSELDPKNAGYRVRTLPLVAELRAQGETVEVHNISALPQAVGNIGAQARAVVISKPADSVTDLCMRRFSALGVPVVIDLFDNYFSWSAAAEQKQIHWQWLRALNGASMVISSTDFLKEVICTLTDKPVLRVSDLVPVFPAYCMTSEWLSIKWERPPCIELLWFGISGNPYYQAGLEDLVRWAEVLRDMTTRLDGCATVRLTVCTNRVPAVAAVLKTLRAHQVDTRYVEWTIAACEALLDSSHVALLPTNLSGFSLSKTHNRCSEALTRGCLVLSSARSPYEDLGGAVFNAPEALVDFLRQATPENVGEQLAASAAALRSGQDLVAEVRQLRVALTAASKAPVPRATAKHAMPSPLILIAAALLPGLGTQLQKMDVMIAACMDEPALAACDFHFDSACTGADPPALVLSERALNAIEEQLQLDVNADIVQSGAYSEVRLDSWILQVHGQARRLVVVQGLPAELLKRFAEAQAGARQGDLALEARVDVMTRVLWRLGLKALSFGGDGVRGWQAFADQADPELAAMAGRLREQWIRFEGREFAWGRPSKDRI